MCGQNTKTNLLDQQSRGVEDEEVELCREVRRRRVGVGGGVSRVGVGGGVGRVGVGGGVGRVGVGGGVGVMGRGGGLAQCLRTGKDELGTGNF